MFRYIYIYVCIFFLIGYNKWGGKMGQSNIHLLIRTCKVYLYTGLLEAVEIVL